MSRKSAKKPAVKRTRQLKSRLNPAILIAAAAAVVLAVVLIIVGIVVFTGKKDKKDQTPETTAPVQAKKVTQAETEETATEEISEAPETETEAETMSPEDARYMEEAGKLVSQMPLEKKVSSLFITTPEALVNEANKDSGQQFPQITQAGEITQSAYDRYPVGGFLIQDMENEGLLITDSVMLNTLNTSLQALSAEPPVLICVDEDYLKKIGQPLGIQETPGSRYTIDTGTLKELGFNVVFSGISSENGSSIRPSVEITAANDISVLNVSDGFLSGYESIGQDGSSTYRTTAATGIGYYRQEKNNSILIVFEDGLYSAANTADELRKIGEEIRGAVAEGFEPVFLSRISDSDVSAANVTGANAGGTSTAETGSNGNPAAPSAPETDANGNPVPPSAPETDANGNPVPPSPAGSSALTPAVRSLLVGADLLLCEDNFIDTLQSVVDAVNSGILTEKEIDDCATRVLAMRMKCFGSGMVGGGTDTLSQSESSGSQSENSAGTSQSDSNAGAGTPQSDGSGASQSENSAGTPQSDGSSTSQSDSNAGTPQSDGSGTSQSDNNAGTPQSDGSGTSQSDANAGSPADGSTLPNGN